MKLVLLFCVLSLFILFTFANNLVVRESQVRDTTLVSPTTLATKASTTEEPHTSGELLARLRRFMRDTNIIGIPIDAYIVPSRDEHNSEFVSLRDNRLNFITNGFSGSNGEAIITLDKAGFWTDGRYHLQAEAQLDTEYWTIFKSGLPNVPTREEWLKNSSVLPQNSIVAIDPFLMSSIEYEKLSEKLAMQGHKLIGLNVNLVDLVWSTDRPDFVAGEIYAHDFEFTGQAAVDKITSLREDIKSQNADVIVITVLDEIAWLLNLRGKDQINTPIFYSFLIVTQKDVILFVTKSRITTKILTHFEEEGIDVLIKSFDKNLLLIEIETIIKETSSKCLISTSTPAAITNTIPKKQRINAFGPVALMRCTKNPVEAEGLRQAHKRDGVAMAQFLYWIEKHVDDGNVTEISAAKALEKFRREQEHNMGISFESVSSFGSNSAIIHYMPTHETDRLITRDEIYLIDSGGQYLDGTTDVTRTIHLGTPTDFQKECYTRVLKGQLAVGASIFPKKAPGSFFDAIARKPLWDVGLDYRHGTGHGIGSFLNVHEFPPRLSSTGVDSFTPGALENMFTSNEPGYYQEGEFGIRIEDIVQIVPAYPPNDFGGRGALSFLTVTLVPHQLKMIDLSLLTKAEVQIIDTYHHRVLEEIGNLLKNRHSNVYEWLKEQTVNISVYYNLMN